MKNMKLNVWSHIVTWSPCKSRYSRMKSEEIYRLDEILAMATVCLRRQPVLKFLSLQTALNTSGANVKV